MSKRDERDGRYSWDQEQADPSTDERDPWAEPRLMDFARKLVRGGVEAVSTTQGAIRERTSEIKPKEIPKEVIESVAHMTARTKDELVGLMAREFKSYLEKLNLVEEFREIIEDYSLDVNMTIRLRPNEAFEERQAAEEGEEGEEDVPEAEEDEAYEVEEEGEE